MPRPGDPKPAAEPFTDRLRLAVAAYLARFKGSSREHLTAQRPHLELYCRWMRRSAGSSTVTGSCGRAARALRSCVPLPQVVGRALDRAIADRTHGSILLTGAGRECTGIVLPQGSVA